MDLISAQEQRPFKASLIALGVCLWFAAAAGLCERAVYHFFPTALGPDDLWYAAVADLFAFSAIFSPVLLLWPFRRLNLAAIAVFVCSGLLVLDCISIAVPKSSPIHLPLIIARPLAPIPVSAAMIFRLAAPVAALLLTAFFTRFQTGVLRFGKFTLPLFAFYLLAYLVAAPLWVNHEAAAAETAAGPPGAPNVLLIIVDALRADHLSTYGYGRTTSPRLTQFAAQGVIFENAVAPSSWTLPSHASMMTGRAPSEHQAGEYDWRLDGRFPTLGEAFQKAGYRTAAFSGNPFLFCRRVGLGRGFAHFEDGSLLEHLTPTNLGQHILSLVTRFHLISDISGRQNATEISREALRWIKTGNKPFFVTVNYFDVHEPFIPPTSYFRRFSARPKPPDQYYFPQDVRLNSRQLQDEIDAYDASINWVDDQMAAFLGKLQSRGYLQNTIVVVTSDHGQEFQEHGFMFHGKGLYWELIHAPLIIHLPRPVNAGEHVKTPVSLEWLPSTLLELAGIKNDHFPGPAMTALWTKTDAEQSWPYPVSELAHMGDSPLFPSYYGPMKSLVTPEWQYILGGTNGEELYRCCGNDKHDLAKSQAAVASIFHRALDADGPVTQQTIEAVARSAATSHASSTSQAKKHPDKSNREQMNDHLRALGYIP